MLINISNVNLMLPLYFANIDFKGIYQLLLIKLKCIGPNGHILQPIRHLYLHLNCKTKTNINY